MLPCTLLFPLGLMDTSQPVVVSLYMYSIASIRRRCSVSMVGDNATQRNALKDADASGIIKTTQHRRMLTSTPQ